MRKAFICYATENETFAHFTEMMLKEAGYDVRLDNRKARVGDEWRKAIDDGISDSYVLLVVLAPESCESNYVTYEWAYALGNRRSPIELTPKPISGVSNYRMLRKGWPRSLKNFSRDLEVHELAFVSTLNTRRVRFMGGT